MALRKSRRSSNSVKLAVERLDRMAKGRDLLKAYNDFEYDPTLCFLLYLEGFCEKHKLQTVSQKIDIHRLCKKYGLGQRKIRNIVEGRRRAEFKYIMWVVDQLREPITFI